MAQSLLYRNPRLIFKRVVVTKTDRQLERESDFYNFRKQSTVSDYKNNPPWLRQLKIFRGQVFRFLTASNREETKSLFYERAM